MQATAALLSLMALFASPSGQNVLPNGGFEAGTIEPWTVAGGTWQVTDQQPHCGAFAATTTDGGILYQRFGPIRADEVVKISFWIRATDPQIDLDGPFAYYSLDMYDEQLGPLVGAVPIPAISLDWQYWEITPPAVSTHWLEGITIGSAGGRLLLDDVEVISAVGAPEPASLATLALGAIVLLRRRRR